MESTDQSIEGEKEPEKVDDKKEDNKEEVCIYGTIVYRFYCLFYKISMYTMFYLVVSVFNF